MTRNTSVGHIVVRVTRPGIEKQSWSSDWQPITDHVDVIFDSVPSTTFFDSPELSVFVSGVIYQEIEHALPFHDQARYLASLYLSGGRDRIGRVAGIFVAFIISKDTDEVLAFGDARGGRRVFTAQDDQAVYASNKLDVLRELGISSGKPNRPYQDFALVYGYHPGHQTIYEDVLRTETNYLTELTSGELAYLDRPTSPPPVVIHPEPTEAEAIEQLHDRLVAATSAVLGGFSKVAVFLGGFDSALVAALAKNSGADVTAYTFRYQDSEFNQAHINDVTRALGISHNWVPITPNMIGNGLTDYPLFFDRPSNWPNYGIQTLALGRIAVQDGAEMIVTGDGCDEIFLGYPGIYRGSKFFGATQMASPRLLKKVQNLLRHPFFERSLGHIYRLLQRILSNAQLPQRTRLYLMFRIMDESTIAQLYGRDLHEVEENVSRVIREVECSIPDFPSTILAYEGRDNIIPNRLKLVGTMDGAGLPVYSPYMHPLVRDYVRSLPESLLRPNGEAKRDTLGKDVLLKMADQYHILPHDVIYQPKHAAVDGPLDRWYEQNLSDLVLSLMAAIAPIQDQRLARSLVKEKAIEKFYRKHFSVDAITSHAASMLATYGSYFANRDA